MERTDRSSGAATGAETTSEPTFAEWFAGLPEDAKDVVAGLSEGSETPHPVLVAHREWMDAEAEFERDSRRARRNVRRRDAAAAAGHHRNAARVRRATRRSDGEGGRTFDEIVDRLGAYGGRDPGLSAPTRTHGEEDVARRRGEIMRGESPDWPHGIPSFGTVARTLGH